MPFKFEKLHVWQQSIELSQKIHEMCTHFTKDELFILTSQIKKAADSVSLNIAEGSTGQSNKEFSKFLGYSIRSGIEVVGCLYLAKRRHYINESEFNELYLFLNSLIRSIQALRNTLK